MFLMGILALTPLAQAFWFVWAWRLINAVAWLRATRAAELRPCRVDRDNRHGHQTHTTRPHGCGSAAIISQEPSDGMGVRRAPARPAAPAHWSHRRGCGTPGASAKRTLAMTSPAGRPVVIRLIN
jgi:hypothetical protein